MKFSISKIIKFIDRALWASQMASLTSPTYWGRSVHGHESSPWISSVRANESAAHDEVQTVVQTKAQTREFAKV